MKCTQDQVSYESPRGADKDTPDALAQRVHSCSAATFHRAAGKEAQAAGGAVLAAGYEQLL